MKFLLVVALLLIFPVVEARPQIVIEQIIQNYPNGTGGGGGGSDNSSWNEGVYWANATASFYPLTNPNNYISSYTETDPVWTSEKANYATLAYTDGVIGGINNLSLAQISANIGNWSAYEPNYMRNDGDTATGNYTFDTNTFHIDSTNDRIGVGTTTPSYPLEVDGIVRATNLSLPGYISGSGILKSRLSDIIISNDLGGNAQFRLLPYLDDIYFENLYEGDMYFRTDTDTGGPSTVQMFIDGNNNRVGMGLTNPTERLHVKDSIDGNIFTLEDTDGTCKMNPEAGGVTTTCSSDEKYKTNITPVNKTKVFQYLRTWTECMREYNIIASGDTMIGPIAQCVNETLPELVTQETSIKQNVTEYTVLVEYEGEWINETRQNITQWNETYLSVQQPDTNRLLIGAAFLYEKNQELETQLQTVRQAGIAQKQRIDALCAIAPGGTC